jgi:thioredoxin reductase (NADPH)
VITAAELRDVPIFAGVSEEELAKLAAGAADVRLAPGEYAAHEGDPRALFVVLSGHIEVVKTFEGVERTIGKRAPGQIFGEVPVIIGIAFQGSFRATVASRVMRVEASRFYALAATSPDALTRVGELARERLGGLQGFAAAPAKKRATLASPRFDEACRELRTFLTRNQISFEWMPVDDAGFEVRWPGAKPLAAEDMPAVCCDDGTTIPRATTRAVAEKLGLQTSARGEEYDAVIVGGGPAGLAAAVYGASEGLRTIVVEREAPGGQAETSSRIENYLGFPTGVSGEELARRALQQAIRLGAEIVVTRSVKGLDVASRTVQLDEGATIRARTIVLATGVTWRRLSIEGFDRFLGKGVFYGASRSEAATTQGRDVHLVGAGNSAGQAAIFFASHARMVTLVVRGDSLDRSMSRYLAQQLRTKSNIHVLLRAEVKGVHGATQLEAVDLVDHATGATRRCESGGVFVFIGADAETGWLPGEIARDERGYVLTGEAVVRAGRWKEPRDPYLLETSVPGVFACGDVRASPVKRVAAAVGEGSMAIAFIRQYLGAS